MSHKNRYFFIGKVDLGPKIKIADAISGRPIRRVFVVKDYGPTGTQKKPKILSISKTTAQGLLATELNSVEDADKVQRLWKTINSSLKWINPEQVALTVKAIERNGSSHIYANFLDQLCRGYKLSEKQLEILKR